MPTIIDGLTGVNKLDPDLVFGQSEDTTPDTANDFVLAYDASAGALKKVKMANAAPPAAPAFATGTLMLFQQTAAPTGWTKQTTHNDKALRVVSGTASSGGTSAFSTVFGKTASDAFTLTTAHMPSHTHGIPILNSQGGGEGPSPGTSSVLNTVTSGSAGSGGSHSHGMDIRVQYVDLIIAAKD